MKRLRSLLKKLGIVLCLLVALLILFLLEENIRGKIALHRYISQLRAHGEKLTLPELDLPKPTTEGNGAAALVALTNQFVSLGRNCPFYIYGAVPRIRLVAPGRAAVRCDQSDLGVNLINSGSPGRGRFALPVDENVDVSVVAPVRAGWAALDEQVARASNTLEEVRAALAQPVLEIEIDYREGDSIRLRHLGVTRSAATWLALTALNELHHHNCNGAAGSIITIAALTRFQKGERLISSQIARWQAARMGLDVTWEAFQASGWTEEQLVSLERAWQESGVIQDQGSALDMERIFVRDSFEQARRVPTWKELLHGSYDLSDFFSDIPVSVHFITWRLAWIDQTEFRYLRRSQLVLDRARSAVARRAWSAFDLSEKDFPDARSLYDRWRYGLFDPSTFIGVPTVLRNAFRFEAQREMTLAAIAIKRYQLRTGKLPPDLAALVPKYLPQLPNDWMDGQPLRYHPNQDGTFTLYSVGVDGRDDGGDPAPMKGRWDESIWNGRDAVWPMPATAEEVAELERKLKR